MKIFILMLLMTGVFLPCFSQTIVDRNTTGGSINVFELQNNVLFIPTGPAIEFYDSSGDGLELINSVYPFECNDLVDIMVSGNSLFIIGDMSQVMVYDISDLENPVITNQGQMPEGVHPHWSKNILALSGNMFYIATEDGIYKADLGNADLVFEKCVDEDVFAIAIHGNWIYGITNWYGTYSLKSWDLTDPTYSVNYDEGTEYNDLDIFGNLLVAMNAKNLNMKQGLTTYQVDGVGGLTQLSQVGVEQSYVTAACYNLDANRLITCDREGNQEYYISVYNVADLQNPVLEFPRFESRLTNFIKYADGKVYQSVSGDDNHFVKSEIDAGVLVETSSLSVPYSISATCNIDNNLFIGSESLMYLYRLGESNKPELVKTYSNEDYSWGNNIKALAGKDSRLYVMDGLENVTVCDVDNDELIPRGSFNAEFTSTNYLIGNTNVAASVELSFSDQQVRFFDCSDPDNPVETLTWNWFCRDWVITPEEDYMIFSSVETNDIFFYDITNGASVQQAGTFTVSGTQASLAVSDSILIVASLTSTDPFVSTIEVYSITDVSAPVLLAQTNIDGQVFDVQVENDYILVALGEDGWQILDLIREASGSNLKSTQVFPFNINFVMGYYQAMFMYYNIPFFIGSAGEYFFAFLQNLFGEYFTDYYGMPSFVVDLPRQPVVSYELEIAISPPEAKEHGCSVSPDVGKYSHTMGYVESLTATDNPTDGWVFKEWQGDASGNAKNASVTMDDDKNVTAVFEEVYLYLSKDVTMKKCPCEYETESGLKIDIHFYLDAVGDDWMVTGFELEDKESNLYPLITEGKILTAGATHATFTWEQFLKGIQLETNIEVPETNTVEITVSLTPNDTFIEQALENEESRFTIRVRGAFPVNKAGGKSSGQPEANLKFGPVFNNHENYFSSIGEAVQDPSTTDGDTVYICPKLYQENILLEKNLTLKGIVCNEDKPVLSPFENFQTMFFSKDSLNIIDLDFITHYGAIKTMTDGASKINFLRSKFYCSSPTAKPFIDVTECSLHIEESEFNYTGSAENDNTCIKTLEGAIGLRNNKFRDFKNGIKAHCVKFNGFYDNEFSDIDYPVEMSITTVNNTSHWGIFSVYYCPFEKNRFENFKCAVKIYNVLGENASTGNPSYKTHLIANASANNLVFYDNNFSSSNKYETGISISNSFVPIVINNNDFRNVYFSTILDFNYYFTVSNNNFKSSGSDIVIKECSISKSDCLNMNQYSVFLNRSSGSDNFMKVTEHTGDLFITRNHAKNDYGYKKSVGIDASNSEREGSLNISGNTMEGFCTGLKTENWQQVLLDGNSIKDATCDKTGIFISNSEGKVTNSNLSDNVGAAISVSGESEIVVSDVNFSGNETAIANNSTSPVLANNNYWGTADGPVTGDISGDVIADEWLGEKKKLIVSFSYDTLYLPFDSEGEIPVISTNFDNPNDSIWFTFSGDLAWVFVPDDLEAMVDSTGVINYLLYETPANPDGGGFATINVSAVSTGSGEEAVDSVVLALYEPIVTTVSIDPDAFSVFVDDSVFISAMVFDQFNNAMESEPYWEADAGMFENGYYFPDETGLVTISATVEELRDELMLNIVDEIPVVSSIEIDPEMTMAETQEVIFFDASAYDQFGYPIGFSPEWEASEGNVFSGYFSAPESPGQYTVTVIDTATEVEATAVVDVYCTMETILNESVCSGESFWLGENEYTESGTYNHTFIREGMCDSMVTLNLTVLPLPDVQLDLPDTCMLESDPLVLEYGIPAGGTYTMNGEEISVFEPTETGDYEILYSYTDENGCMDIASDIITVVSGLGSDGLINPGVISVYPNPVTDQLIVEFSKIAGLDVKLELEIVSITGQKLLSKEVSSFYEQKEILDVSRFVSGIYLLKIYNSKCVHTQTFVIR